MQTYQLTIYQRLIQHLCNLKPLVALFRHHISNKAVTHIDSTTPPREKYKKIKKATGWACKNNFETNSQLEIFLYSTYD